MAIEMNLEQAKEFCMDVFYAKRVPGLLSSPGLGKSDLARQIAQEQNLKFIDIRLSQMDPADLNGFPWTNEDKTRATYIPMDLFPLEGDPIPEGYKGWLVLMDELPSSPPSVLAASYKVLLDKMVGNKKLHKRAIVMTAGNLATDKALVNDIGTALQSRVIWGHIKPDLKTWDKWAVKNDIDHRVRSYLHFQPDSLHKFNPDHQEDTFPCPRTWEFTSDVIKPYDKLKHNKLPLLAGCIGEGEARQFFAFTQIRVPTIQQIMSNPMNIAISNEPGTQYALAGLVGHHLNKTSAKQLMPFISRLTIDFQVLCLRAAIARDRTVKNADTVKSWIAVNAEELRRR